MIINETKIHKLEIVVNHLSTLFTNIAKDILVKKQDYIYLLPAHTEHTQQLPIPNMLLYAVKQEVIQVI